MSMNTNSQLDRVNLEVCGGKGQAFWPTDADCGSGSTHYGRTNKSEPTNRIMNPTQPGLVNLDSASNSLQNKHWPTMLIVHEPGFHDLVNDLLAATFRSLRIRVLHAGSQADALSLLGLTRVDLFLVAGCGSGPVNPRTAHVVEAAGEPVKFDGLEVGKAIKRAFPTLPGIFCSGYPFGENIQAQIDRHGMAFLPKPFTASQLCELLLLLLWRDGKTADNADHFISCAKMKKLTGDLAGASRDLDQALELAFADAEAFNLRSEVRRRLGDASGATADGTAAIKLLPHYTNAYCNRGLARWATGDLNGAIADFSSAIQLSPTSPEHYYYRGCLKHVQQDLPGALADLNRAHELVRPSIELLERRGDIKKALGDLDGAIADYTKVIAMRPA